VRSTVYVFCIFFADKMSVGGAHTGAISAPPPDVQSQLENLLFKVLKLSLLSRGFYITLFKQKHLNFCAADFALLNLPKGKSLGRSKPATSSYLQALQHTVWDDSYYIQALLNCLL
jgi:hypothetical protein